METEIMANITRLLAQGSKASAEWQAQKLAQMGALRRMNQEVLREYLPQALEAAREEIQLAGVKSAKSVDALMTADKLSAALPIEADINLMRIWATWENDTMNKYGKLGMTLIDQAEQIYIDTVYKATAETLAGSKTLRQAIAETAATWADRGIPALIDRAGREWSVEAYAQTVIRSNTRQVTTQTSFARMGEMGQDLVEISSHIDARPGCAPYQGKIYSLSGNHEKYPPLSSTTYGEPDGLFGINCRHTMYPYFPGTEKTFDVYPMSEVKENYAESQEQRRLERGIRQAKREIATLSPLKGPAEIERAKELLADRQKAMREFISDTDRTRRYEREQIQDKR